MNRKAWIIVVLILIGGMLSSALAIDPGAWAKIYGGKKEDKSYSIVPTNDGGYIVAGETQSYGQGGSDGWVLRLDAEGSIIWQKAYGGTLNDSARSVQILNDGGLVVAGFTSSFGAGKNDIWILRLDGSGTIIWQKTYGGTGNDTAHQIQKTKDGGFIIAGETASFGSGNTDMWIIKLDSSGNIMWEKSYGWSYADVAYSIQELEPDGGYIVAGSGKRYGSSGWLDYAAIVLRLDSNGNIVWRKTFGIDISVLSTQSIEALSVQQTSDNGFIIAGYASLDHDFEYFWIAKLDTNGTLVWHKEFSNNIEPSNHRVYSVKQANDGGYIFTGKLEQNSPNMNTVVFLKLFPDGTIQWQRVYSSMLIAIFYSLEQTNDGGYIMAGEFHTNQNYNDIFVFKTDPMGITPCPSYIGYTWIYGQISQYFTERLSQGNLATTTAIVGDIVDTQPIISDAQQTIKCGPDYAPGVVPDNDNFPGIPLTIAKNGTDGLLLAWEAPGGSCITQSYSIHRGTLPWSDYNHNPVNCAVTSTSASLGSQTESYYYLVVARNNFLYGSYGLDSFNNHRPPSPTACSWELQTNFSCN